MNYNRSWAVLSIMRNRLFITEAVVFFVVLSGTSGAVENPEVSSPAGTGRVPMSSIRSGLVTRPNPIDTSSNLIVTGQVSGGKHFRGVLPYNVDSAFGGRLGSSTLDSFLRYSAGSGNIGRPAGTYEPYYSPTGTVTTMRPGYSGVIRPPTPSGEFRNYAIDGYVDPTVAGESRLPDSEMVSDNTGFRGLRPMAMSQEEIEKIISNEMSNYLQARRAAEQQHQNQIEQFRHKLEQITERPGELKQTPISQDNLLRPYPKDKPGEDVQQQGDSRMPTEQSNQDGQLDIYERMKQQINKLQEALEESAAARQAEKAADGEEKSAGETSQAERPPEPDISAAAKAILGQYESFAAYSQDKFNQYMRAAEMYLKQGKYYRAADAYTLATIYKLDDPLAYAGKSHALFAAGEYMSSALFLSRALEIFPEYAWFKIDLVSMVGDKDILETRIADVEQWVEKNGTGELQFLLAYVYYQMGRLDRAKDNIESAHMKMLGSRAVATLRKAIDDAAKTNKPIK